MKKTGPMIKDETKKGVHYKDGLNLNDKI